MQVLQIFQVCGKMIFPHTWKNFPHTWKIFGHTLRGFGSHRRLPKVYHTVPSRIMDAPSFQEFP